MAGPTPVSALIHAATMVTAGVYMIARSSQIYLHSAFALDIVAIIGLATAFFAATIGLAQNDIKKVFAYSTVSQLGYMFLGLGTGAFSAGNLARDDARVFQGPAVPGRRQRDPRAVAANRICARWAASPKRFRSPAAMLFCAGVAIAGVALHFRLL